MANLKIKLGKRIQQLRKEKGYTQETFAEKIDIATSSLGYLETGRCYPSPENAEKIAKVLGVEIHDLFYFKDINDKKQLLAEVKANVEFLKDNDEKLLALYNFIRVLL